MKLKTLSGQEYSILSSDYLVYGDDVTPKSSLHLLARKILGKLYPQELRLEEIPARINSKIILYADFFLPSKRLVVEVNGEQHYSKNQFFHKNKEDFNKAVASDSFKKQWCEVNNLMLVSLKFDEIEEWENQIVNRN